MMRWLCWRKGRCKRLHVFLPMLLHPLFPFHVQLPLFIAYPFDSAIPFYFPYFSFFLCIPNHGYIPTLLLKDNDTIRLSDIVVQPWCVFVPTSSACVFFCPPFFFPPKEREEKQVAEGDFTKNPWERMQAKWQERIKSKCTGGNKDEGKPKLLAPVYYLRLIVPQTRENGPNTGREVHPIFHFHVTERGHAAAQGGTERTSRLQN